MDLNKENIKKILGIVTFAILLYVGLQHFKEVKAFLAAVLEILFPFILGACIAFILNVPMRAIEKRLFQKRSRKSSAILARLRRPLSLTFTILLVLGILGAVSFLIAPEIGRTFAAIRNRIPGFVDQASDWMNNLAAQYPGVIDRAATEIDWRNVGESILNFLQRSGKSFWTSTIGVASSIVEGIVNFFISVIFAISLLLLKDKLSRHFKQVFYAFLPEAAADKVISVLALSNQIFSKFLSGQFLEALILGAMFFIAMTIFRFPYTLMISVLIAVTALIPLVGTFIGCFIGAFLILITDPIKALWFIVLFLILQQLEGSLIYPHVVGNSVGLPSIWVLTAVTIGGKVMGIAGMLIFIPTVSVLYTLLREIVYKRLKEKKIMPFKWKTS